MPAPDPGAGPLYDRGMVFHQGLPVAMGAVTRINRDRVDLEVGPLGFEAETPVSVDLYPRGDVHAPERRVTGYVEAADRGLLAIRLER
ncbi:hypothetical protein AN478_03780 [Thiohalorhabdus denitrificans]|uniref:Uncharacterized protein n=1 Tax=Thiohalorhabdus denitrificans TaxID=381306 RepID=A0A0P9GLJ8_9GAMM|nr:hypothetical protein [Thiohalorhabdus denitrificans]KPV41055.1 hypothetical protein AN478_03780 [Thiohalorhabdus denitrificans]SCY40243.1 hypothetical protein SAMN05661077_2022 [Thiohalorhabdus denitrificans]